MDDLYLMARLCFVKEVKYFDIYDGTFLYFFEGLELPPVAEGDLDLLETKQFQQYLFAPRAAPALGLDPSVGQQQFRRRGTASSRRTSPRGRSVSAERVDGSYRFGMARVFWVHALRLWWYILVYVLRL